MQSVDLTKAAINLHAILRNLEDLSALDDEARRILGTSRVSVAFHVPGVESLSLHFAEGGCSARRPAESASIVLRFKDAAHFNRMIDGKANPIPTKGFLKLGFLKTTFVQLADRLTRVLRPSAEDLKDPAFARLSTVLTAYAAFFAVPELAFYEASAKRCAERMRDGVIRVEVQDGPAISLVVQDGLMRATKEEKRPVSALMHFDSIETAGGILSGTLDSYAALGAGKLRVQGYIPLVDNLNKILGILPRYLS